MRCIQLASENYEIIHAMSVYAGYTKCHLAWSFSMPEEARPLGRICAPDARPTCLACIAENFG